MDNETLVQENAHLRQLLAAKQEQVETLRKSLQELVERRARVSEEARAHGIPASNEGSDGRYARAAQAIEETK
jgi:hypothetical protein